MDALGVPCASVAGMKLGEHLLFREVDPRMVEIDREVLEKMEAALMEYRDNDFHADPELPSPAEECLALLRTVKQGRG